jgi:hypothetical protein
MKNELVPAIPELSRHNLLRKGEREAVNVT